MKLSLPVLVNPCGGCTIRHNYGNCPLCRETGFDHNCTYLNNYQYELKGRQEMARAIVGYITRLNKKAKREHTGITIGALRIMIEESLKESGVEV